MQTNELVESIFVSVRWDRWRFHIPFVKPLAKQEVAVVSHSHFDHWHPNFYQKDAVLVPWETCVPKQFAGLRNVIHVDHFEKLGRIKFIKIGRRELETFLTLKIEKPPHAFWWLVEANNTRVLFVGDMDVADAEVLRLFCNKTSEMKPLHGVLLPSFGG